MRSSTRAEIRLKSPLFFPVPLEDLLYSFSFFHRFLFLIAFPGPVAFFFTRFIKAELPSFVAKAHP